MRKEVFWVSLFLAALIVGSIGCAPPTAMKDFSADMVMKSSGITQSGKIYFTAKKWRMESTVYGQKNISIVRADKNVMWSIMPAKKMYMEIKLDPRQMAVTTEKLPGEIERKKVGKETISGYLCDKYKIVYKVAEDTPEAVIFQWISKDNIPVKAAAPDGSWSVIYKNIKVGKQPASVFELPAGYKKLEMPKMPY